MLKRIVTYKQEKGKDPIVIEVSEPIEEKHITKNQIAYKNCVIIDADQYKEEPKPAGKKHTPRLDKEKGKVIHEYTDLTFEEMTLEEKVNYLYKQLLKPKEPSKPERPGKPKSETV